MTALISGVVGLLTIGVALQERSDGVLILAGIATVAIVVAFASTGLWLALGVKRDLRRSKREKDRR